MRELQAVGPRRQIGLQGHAQFHQVSGGCREQIGPSVVRSIDARSVRRDEKRECGVFGNSIKDRDERVKVPTEAGRVERTCRRLLVVRLVFRAMQRRPESEAGKRLVRGTCPGGDEVSLLTFFQQQRFGVKVSAPQLTPVLRCRGIPFGIRKAVNPQPAGSKGPAQGPAGRLSGLAGVGPPRLGRQRVVG